MKILKAVELGGLSLILTGVIILFEYNNWPAGSSLSGIALGFSLPAFWDRCPAFVVWQDLRTSPS